MLFAPQGEGLARNDDKIECGVRRDYEQVLNTLLDDHGKRVEPHTHQELLETFRYEDLGSAPMEIESFADSPSLPFYTPIGGSSQSSVDQDIQNAHQDVNQPCLIGKASLINADEHTDGYEEVVSHVEDIEKPRGLKVSLDGRGKRSSTNSIENTDVDTADGRSWFDKNWTILDDGKLGAGKYGSVCKVVRNTSSSKFNASEKGKVYALKREHRHPKKEDSVHSLRHEKMLHEVAKLDSNWKSMELFAFMVECEQNVKCPTWAIYQYCEGRTLYDIQDGFNDFVPAGLIIDIMDDISTALTWLHSEVGFKPPMAHRDFHGSNVMLDLSRPVPHGRYPHVRILDFGLAACLSPDTTDDFQRMNMRSYQHDDINSFARVIHGLVHKDDLECLDSGCTATYQFTHCYGETWEDRELSRDPNSDLFDENDQTFWDLIMEGSFKPDHQLFCNHGLDMADLNVYIQKYVAIARTHLRSLPLFEIQYDNTMSSLRAMRPSPTLLPTEHQPSPMPPSPPPTTPEPIMSSWMANVNWSASETYGEGTLPNGGDGVLHMLPDHVWHDALEAPLDPPSCGKSSSTLADRLERPDIGLLRHTSIPIDPQLDNFAVRDQVAEPEKRKRLHEEGKEVPSGGKRLRMALENSTCSHM